MAEAKQIVFSHAEVAEALARLYGLTEGLWQLYMEFAIAGANVGAGPMELNPAAIVPVVKFGLLRVEEPTNLTVDASKLGRPGKEPTSGTSGQ
jgi:hypothetical protein